jgi:hypothetical protein
MLRINHSILDRGGVNPGHLIAVGPSNRYVEATDDVRYGKVRARRPNSKSQPARSKRNFERVTDPGPG